MARFFGVVGYRETVEKRRGVWLPQIVERQYFGDVIRRASQNQPSADSENMDMKYSNEISIIADPYAYENFSNLVYVVWLGQKWSISRVEAKPPRLIISIGGIYNDPSEQDNIPNDECPYMCPCTPDRKPSQPSQPSEPGETVCDHVLATDKEAQKVLDDIFIFQSANPESPDGYTLASDKEIESILSGQFDKE